MRWTAEFSDERIEIDIGLDLEGAMLRTEHPAARYQVLILIHRNHVSRRFVEFIDPMKAKLGRIHPSSSLDSSITQSASGKTEAQFLKERVAVIQICIHQSVDYYSGRRLRERREFSHGDSDQLPCSGPGMFVAAVGATMSRGDIFATVSEFLEEIAGISPGNVNDDSTLDGELEMNSVKFVELQVALEDEFDIFIDPVAVVELNRLGSIVDYLAELVAEKSA